MDRIRDKFRKFRNKLPRFAYYRLSPELVGFINRIGENLEQMGSRPRHLNAGAQRIVGMVRDVLEEYLEKIDFPMGVKYHDTDAERAEHKSIIEHETEVLAHELDYLFNPFQNTIGMADLDDFTLAIQHILAAGAIFAGNGPVPPASLADNRHTWRLEEGKKTGADIDFDFEDVPDDRFFDDVEPYLNLDEVGRDFSWSPPSKKPRGSGKIKRRRRKTKK